MSEASRKRHAARSSRPRGRLRERAALGTGVLSAAGLVAAAVLLPEPDRAGEVRLAREAAEIADAVTREWRQLLRTESWHAGTGSVTWSQADFDWIDQPDERPWADDFPEPDDRFTAFDALLRESEIVELEHGDPEAALRLVDEALETEPGRRRATEARLRALQLAMRAGTTARALERWSELSAGLRGDEARDGTSYLLLAALAIEPALDDAERRRLAERLLDLWVSHSLALPDWESTFVWSEGTATAVPGGRRAVLARRLAQMHGEPHPVLVRDERLGRVQALRRAARAVPMPANVPTDLLAFLPCAEGVIAYQGLPGGGVRGRLLLRTLPTSRLKARCERLDLLSPGFTLDLRGDAAEQGAVVRSHQELAPGGLGFTLRHEDPAAFIAGESTRLRYAQAGLWILAVLAALSGATSFEALRRERRLQQMKLEFVANVSHELRTPLSSILLMAENLEEGRVRGEESVQRYHGMIRREAGRLRRLVDDVLDFASDERGGTSRLRREEVALDAFLDALEREAATLARGADVALSCARIRLPEALILDAEAVRRAVLNLVDNALRHSGSTELALTAEGLEQFVALRVSDRGRGIAVAERASVFDPFRQGKGSGSGAGLGLAIVRGIVEGHGGEVRVRANPDGVGTVFELRLPTRPESAAAIELQNEVRRS